MIFVHMQETLAGYSPLPLGGHPVYFAYGLAISKVYPAIHAQCARKKRFENQSHKLLELHLSAHTCNGSSSIKVTIVVQCYVTYIMKFL